MPATAYRFGRFLLQPAAQRLWVDGEPTSVGARAFDLLVTLVLRAGELVSKGELLDRVWPGLVVEENNLQVQVSALRKILGPGAIATVAGRGYRFDLVVQPVIGDAPDATGPDGSGSPTASVAVGDATAAAANTTAIVGADGAALNATAAALPGQAAAGAPSIAVLPFVNLSDDAANEYFADGLSEELLNVLSRIRGLRVASRRSAFSFKGAAVDLATVAARLNVATVLEGSVRKAGNRVRVTAQLVNVATDSQLWAQAYDRELEDIFAVQDDIAQSVVHEIRTALLGEPAGAAASAQVSAEVQAAVRGRSADAEAYRLYLEGTFFLNRYNEVDVRKAIAAFRRALELDPGYAQAWASLSFAYLHQEANAWAPIAEGAQKAREAALRALAVGPGVSASHWALGAVQMYHDWDWRAAEASIRRALQLAPEDSQLILAATLMQDLAHLDEAATLVAQALELDPLNVDAHMAAGMLRVCTGEPELAERAFRKALELGSAQRVRVRYCLGRACLMQGRVEEARHEFAQEVHETFRLLGAVLVEHAAGRAAEAAAALRELTLKYADGAAYQVAQAHAFCGEADAAFAWLERAYAQRDAGLASLQVDRLFDALRGDPRWTVWLRRMRFS